MFNDFGFLAAYANVQKIENLDFEPQNQFVWHIKKLKLLDHLLGKMSLFPGLWIILEIVWTVVNAPFDFVYYVQQVLIRLIKINVWNTNWQRYDSNLVHL